MVERRYRRSATKRASQIIDDERANRGDEDIAVPNDLEKQVRKQLTEHAEVRWDRAVSGIAGAREAEEDDDDHEPDDDEESDE
jgi:hypothetical protein